MSDADDNRTDREDFEAAALPLLDVLYRTARTLTRRDADARDLVQETYLKALDRFASFEPGTNCKAWMMRIMRNAWIDRLRHRKVAGPRVPIEEAALAAPEPAPAPATGPADDPAGLAADILEQFSDAEVIDALMELPEIQRTALFLSDVEDLTQEEAAEVLDVAVGTVKSRVSRARRALAARLKAHARDLGFLGRRSCDT